MGGPGLSRRELVASVGALAPVFGAEAALPRRKSRPIPLIHQTDLFRPHMDPDDHFDLACAFAMARAGHVRLMGVLCDAPPPGHAGDPDVAAVAMLNHLTGLAVPLVVGATQRPASRRDKMEGLPAAGVEWLINCLRRSPEPAIVTVVGSCRDVALAARRAPDTFARKCRGIYLNAGTGTPDPRTDDGLEYNVALDPASYASLFDAPCPIHWMPCFERVGPSVPDICTVARHGTYFGFKMEQVFRRLSPPMQRYFLSMLAQESGSQWLRSLQRPVDAAELATWGDRWRNMWCTAAFIHMAGQAVSTSGQLMPASDCRQPAFRFTPVRVACGDDGKTIVQPGRGTPPRWKLEVTDTTAYPTAMTTALGTILSPLGR